MTSSRMEKQFMCTYFPVRLSGNSGEWFKALRPSDIVSFEQLRYLYLNNFMKLRKRKGDVNSIMAHKKKKGESILTYYDRFTLATLNVQGHGEFLVTGAFSQGLLPNPLSKKMQGTVPPKVDKEKGKYCEYNKRKTHDTDERTTLRKKMDEKHLMGDLTTIAKDLRSMFDIEQRNTRDRKDGGKRQSELLLDTFSNLR